jgi:aarF domain-containing kinase
MHAGAFNGDPHPGNILLLKDGRLGLIDYGQVRYMNVLT